MVNARSIVIPFIQPRELDRKSFAGSTLPLHSSRDMMVGTLLNATNPYSNNFGETDVKTLSMSRGKLPQPPYYRKIQFLLFESFVLYLYSDEYHFFPLVFIPFWGKVEHHI